MGARGEAGSIYDRGGRWGGGLAFGNTYYIRMIGYSLSHDGQTQQTCRTVVGRLDGAEMGESKMR